MEENITAPKIKSKGKKSLKKREIALRVPERRMSEGRPSIYTEEIADEICNRIAKGESLKSIVSDERMPGSSTVYRWLLDDSKTEFWEKYEKARNIQMEIMFEELVEIADEAAEIIVGDDKSDGARVQANRLRVDTRKWYLSKVAPKKYGDKLDLTSGGEKIKPTANQIVFVDFRNDEHAESEPEV